MKKGFTLAEVLITLGIVGVIAVLTVPSVMQDYKNKLYVTQLKKAYIDITNGIQQELNDEHLDNFHLTKGSNGAQYFLTNYITHSKGSACTNDCIKKLTGKDVTYESTSGDDAGTFSAQYGVITKYGAVITMRTDEDYDAIFYIDVNGAEPPNITGRDIFSLVMRNGTNEVTDPNTNPAKCNSGEGNWHDTMMKYTAGCFQSIMENNWTMKY